MQPFWSVRFCFGFAIHHLSISETLSYCQHPPATDYLSALSYMGNFLSTGRKVVQPVGTNYQKDTVNMKTRQVTGTETLVLKS